MSKSGASRTAGPESKSAIDPEVLALYQRAAAASERGDVRLLMQIWGDYGTLAAICDEVRALGAELEFIDVALRIAATPAGSDALWGHKKQFFERYFGPLATSFVHVGRVADAAVAAERLLRSRHAAIRN